MCISERLHVHKYWYKRNDTSLHVSILNESTRRIPSRSVKLEGLCNQRSVGPGTTVVGGSLGKSVRGGERTSSPADEAEIDCNQIQALVESLKSARGFIFPSPKGLLTIGVRLQVRKLLAKVGDARLSVTATGLSVQSLSAVRSEPGRQG